MNLKQLAAVVCMLLASLASNLNAAVAVGDEPELVGKTLDDKDFDLKDYRGKVVALFFWASFCPECKRVTPDLETLEAKYRNQGFQFVGVNVEYGKRVAKAREFVEE